MIAAWVAFIVLAPFVLFFWGGAIFASIMFFLANNTSEEKVAAQVSRTCVILAVIITIVEGFIAQYIFG